MCSLGQAEPPPDPNSVLGIVMSTLVQSQFDEIAEIARELWGLSLTEKKFQLVSNRLASFLRKNKQFASVDEYLEHLRHEADEEDKLVFFDILSTNVTSFFRDSHHFDFLEREFYTPLARGNLTVPGRKIRIWSAACSTGPEPYSLAMHALECLPDIDSWDFRILATDLSNSAVAAAKEAIYPAEMASKLDPSRLRRFFMKGSGANKDKVAVAPEVRRLVTVRRLNLMDDWPFKGQFDVVFLRNVMIYFDKPTRERLVNRIADVMRPGAFLAVGSAETLSGLAVPVRALHTSFYVK